MVESSVLRNIEHTADGADSWVFCAENKAFDSRMNHGACAHRARFKRDVERRIEQAIRVECRGCRAHCDDLGMRRGIDAGDGTIEAFGDDDAVLHDNGADGYFAIRLRFPSEFERSRHEGERVAVYSHSIVAGGLLEMS